MGMFDNFDNVPEYYIPDNRIEFLDSKGDTIVVGGTCTYTFETDIGIEDYCNVEIHFKQGISLMLIKYMNECTIEELGNKTIITTTLSPDETSFVVFDRDVLVQAKITLITGDVLYSKILKLKVLPTLEY